MVGENLRQKKRGGGPTYFKAAEKKQNPVFQVTRKINLPEPKRKTAYILSCGK